MEKLKNPSLKVDFPTTSSSTESTIKDKSASTLTNDSGTHGCHNCKRQEWQHPLRLDRSGGRIVGTIVVLSRCCHCDLLKRQHPRSQPLHLDCGDSWTIVL
ncbi:hypothetical protein Fot_09799 [Forsythia ovata]|uniref:Uncharacterized protein n=1 Tax=Forsythia ovata TaxID=205694 RepID=A0ABD1WF02_9LAMI